MKIIRILFFIISNFLYSEIINIFEYKNKNEKYSLEYDNQSKYAIINYQNKDLSRKSYINNFVYTNNHQPKLLFDSEHIYFSFYYYSHCYYLGKINKKNFLNQSENYLTTENSAMEFFSIIDSPIPASSGLYGFNYSQQDFNIYIKIIGPIDKINSIPHYKRYLYNNNNDIWIPLNDNNEEIYEDARSAIKDWFYDGKLKRWYPEIGHRKFDKEVWFEQTPTTELRNYPMKLWSKEEKGEEINYPEEYKKKFSEERERLRLEEEKRIAEEKQKFQQKIFIILGILFLVILGGFLIKRLKKKKIIKDHKR